MIVKFGLISTFTIQIPYSLSYKPGLHPLTGLFKQASNDYFPLLSSVCRFWDVDLDTLVFNVITVF